MVNESVTNLNVELANNILKLKEAQEENIKKGKMAQLGQLTATVAHEIRNPLGAIKTSTQLVERKVKGKNLGLEKSLERINNGVSGAITSLPSCSTLPAPRRCNCGRPMSTRG